MTVKQIKTPTLPSSAAGSLLLCFDVDCDSGLEVDGEMIFENRDLRDQALDQRLVKPRDGGGLLPDEILKVSDQPHLLVSNNTVNLGLLPHVPEPENLVRDCIVVIFLVGFLQELLLQFPEALIDDLWRQSVSLFDYRGDVGLQGFQKVVFFAEHLIDSLNDYLLQVFLIDRPRSANMAGIL